MSSQRKTAVALADGEKQFDLTLTNGADAAFQRKDACMVPLTADGSQVRTNSTFTGTIEVDVQSNPQPVATQTTVAVAAAASTLVLAASATRRYLLIQNTGSFDAFITFGTPTGANGFKIASGGNYEWTDPDIRYTGAVTAIGDGVNATTLKVMSLDQA